MGLIRRIVWYSVAVKKYWKSKKKYIWPGIDASPGTDPTPVIVIASGTDKSDFIISQAEV